MKALGRRGLLKLLGAGAAAAPVLGTAALGAGASGTGWGSAALGALSGHAGYDYPQPAVAPPGGSLNWNLLKFARKAYERACGDVNRRMSYRIGGFDHDIAALVSVPLSAKIRMQRTRDDDARGFLEKLRAAAWPED